MRLSSLLLFNTDYIESHYFKQRGKAVTSLVLYWLIFGLFHGTFIIIYLAAFVISAIVQYPPYHILVLFMCVVGLAFHLWLGVTQAIFVILRTRQWQTHKTYRDYFGSTLKGRTFWKRKSGVLFYQDTRTRGARAILISLGLLLIFYGTSVSVLSYVSAAFDWIIWLGTWIPAMVIIIVGFLLVLPAILTRRTWISLSEDKRYFHIHRGFSLLPISVAKEQHKLLAGDVKYIDRKLFTLKPLIREWAKQTWFDFVEDCCTVGVGKFDDRRLFKLVVQFKDPDVDSIAIDLKVRRYLVNHLLRRLNRKLGVEFDIAQIKADRERVGFAKRIKDSFSSRLTVEEGGREAESVKKLLDAYGVESADDVTDDEKRKKKKEEPEPDVEIKEEKPFDDILSPKDVKKEEVPVINQQSEKSPAADVVEKTEISQKAAPDVTMSSEEEPDVVHIVEESPEKSSSDSPEKDPSPENSPVKIENEADDVLLNFDSVKNEEPTEVISIENETKSLPTFETNEEESQESPVKEEESPAKEEESPAKEEESPAKEEESPETKIEEQSGSPQKEEEDGDVQKEEKEEDFDVLDTSDDDEAFFSPPKQETIEEEEEKEPDTQEETEKIVPDEVNIEEETNLLLDDILGDE